MTWRPLPSLALCHERLEMLFPRSAFDTAFSSPLAAWAVAAMIYVDAVVPASGELPADATWAKPTTVLWLSEDAFARDDRASRAAFSVPQARNNRAVVELYANWGIEHASKYADTTREPLRDETWPKWHDEGAARMRPGVATSSPIGRWALTDAFADLFDPALQGDDLADAIERFRDTYMTPGGRAKAHMAERRADLAHEVAVTLPDGTVRHLAPGESSVILQGVVESWAPARLHDPVVLTISEPGDKVYTADAQTIARLGLSIDPATLLPDALLVDIGANPVEFWIVEVVATDGPIDEDRKRRLLRWAAQQRIPESACRFMTAFASRNAAPARKRLKDLAVGTYAWYADEPGLELAWGEVERD